MTVNRYRGGRRERVEFDSPPSPPSPLPAADEKVPPPKTPGRRFDVLQRLDPSRLETEDLLILAILWLLYRESGETEMLVAIGAYLFL